MKLFSWLVIIRLVIVVDVSVVIMLDIRVDIVSWEILLVWDGVSWFKILIWIFSDLILLNL